MNFDRKKIYQRVVWGKKKLHIRNQRKKSYKMSFIFLSISKKNCGHFVFSYGFAHAQTPVIQNYKKHSPDVLSIFTQNLCSKAAIEVDIRLPDRLGQMVLPAPAPRKKSIFFSFIMKSSYIEIHVESFMKIFSVVFEQ